MGQDSAIQEIDVEPAESPEPQSPPRLPGRSDDGAEAEARESSQNSSRRVARRRPAGPVRGRIAANDDAPSIGGLIYALEQAPSNKPFKVAAIVSIVWALIGGVYGYVTLAPELAAGTSLLDIVAKPVIFSTLTAVVVPIAVVWFLALLAWRAEELRLRSSTMTEVAVRLAEPDRMAEQSVASLGQAVRRQVSFMNDAVSRALGRAGELEALVHNEVAALERSYEENERKIRGLIQELSGERHALLNTSERVTDTLRNLGTEVPALIEKLTGQQIKLAHIIQGAGENLTALETSIGGSTIRLESALGGQTGQLQAVLEGYTTALASALSSRSDQMQQAFDQHMLTLDSSLSNRTQTLQSVFEEYARALDTSLANRAQALDVQLIERTKFLDEAFSERLRMFDESIMRSAGTIDNTVNERASALTMALDSHAKTFRDTIGKQALELDESLMHGINAVRRTSENITRQSLKAIEGLASQSDMLKNVSENLLNQIASVTTRFENQGSTILKAANALESANYKIETTLHTRHSELSNTLDKLSGKADEFGKFVEDYSSTIEGSLTDVEYRTRAEMERMRNEANAESERALEDLRNRFSNVSHEVNSQLGTLSYRVTETAEDIRQRAARATQSMAEEEMRLREQMDQIPLASRESTEAMRRALKDQLQALDQLSQITQRGARSRDVTPPMLPQTAASAQPARSMASLGSTLSKEIATRQRPTSAAPPTAEPKGDGWSLGDLLSRASRDEDGHSSQAARSAVFALNIDTIARSLDQATASAIWGRIRGGQRGVMARSIYSAESRRVFDELQARVPADGHLQRTINRYLADFERIIAEADGRDPSGRLSQSHLVAETGRVYLFLAHATGRLS